MKKFFRFAAIAFAAFALLSCEKDPQDEGGQNSGGTGQTTTPEYTENLAFTLTVTEVEADKAKVKVEHNGTTKDTWYGFATTEKDVQKAIADVIAEGGVTLKKNTSTTMTVRGLEPETKYTFVAVGITADGKTYGEVATVEFTTTAAAAPTPDSYTVNPAWAITYIHNFEYEGQIFEHVVEITANDENPYFVIAWPKDLYEQYGIDAIAQAEIDGWKEYLAGTQYTFADVLGVGNNMMDITDLIDVEEYGNEWYAIAVGADANGNPTNLYAISELITVEEEELDPAYAEWLGDWTFTGSNGVTWSVTMKKGIANTSYKLVGWEGPESSGLDIMVDWYAEEGLWAIFAQSFGVYSFGANGNGEIWLTPTDTEGYIYPEAGVPACLGGVTEEGEKIVIGYSEEMEDGSLLEMTTMMYLVQLEADGNFYNITSTTEWPTFPLTVTPATATASTRSVEKTSFGPAKKIETSRTFSTFGTPFMAR